MNGFQCWQLYITQKKLEKNNMTSCIITNNMLYINILQLIVFDFKSFEVEQFFIMSNYTNKKKVINVIWN